MTNEKNPSSHCMVPKSFVLCLIAILFAEGGILMSACATTYDLSADSSFAENPNGVWQFGYSETKSLALDQFRLAKFRDTVNSIVFWHPDKGPSGYYPYIAHNSTKALLIDINNAWAVHPGELAMEASNTGQYSIIRFVAPSTGDYKVNADFAGIHRGLSTTDVHVLHNDESLFAAEIEGYGGDPSFHETTGLNPKASYSGVLHLKANDILTFAVGYGKNQTHYNDTTGLFLHIQSIP